MACRISRRAFTSIAFCILFALVAGDAIQQAKESTVHGFDKIKDKISITAEDIQTLLHLASQKEIDSKKNRSFTTTLFNIIFPSSRPAVNALLATAYISGPPNFLLALCPPNIDPASLNVMVAFAVGGLLGDTFFHLLPEIFLGEDDSETKVRVVLLEPNRNLLLGIFIFIGLATFMAMDKALRIATGTTHGHSHEHKHIEKLKKKAREHVHKHDYRLTDNLQEIAEKESPKEQQQRLYSKPYNDTNVGGRKTRDVVADLAATNEGIRKRVKSNGQSTTRASSSPSSSDSDTGKPKHTPLTSAIPDPNPPRELNPSVKLAGLLNLLADFTHNITDGLALSTSFYASPALGATTTMAVFFHEIPHEVGDFALLVQSGFSKRNAMAAQFVTAVGAFLGTAIGILVQEYGGGSSGGDAVSHTLGQGGQGLWGTSLQWADTLLPFTAGTFLYVGTVGVIPELLENEKGGDSTRAQEVKRTLLQFAAMAFGALIMVAISWG